MNSCWETKWQAVLTAMHHWSGQSICWMTSLVESSRLLPVCDICADCNCQPPPAIANAPALWHTCSTSDAYGHAIGHGSACQFESHTSNYLFPHHDCLPTTASDLCFSTTSPLTPVTMEHTSSCLTQQNVNALCRMLLSKQMRCWCMCIQRTCDLSEGQEEPLLHSKRKVNAMQAQLPT